MKKIRLAMIAMLVLMLGGCNMGMGSQEISNNIDYQKEENRIAKYFVNHYELASGDTIEKIEFVEFGKNQTSGFWRITLLVNEEYNISFAEGDIGGELSAGGYYSNEIMNLSDTKNSKDIDNIEIIYLEGPQKW